MITKTKVLACHKCFSANGVEILKIKTTNQFENFIIDEDGVRTKVTDNYCLVLYNPIIGTPNIGDTIIVQTTHFSKNGKDCVRHTILDIR